MPSLPGLPGPRRSPSPRIATNAGTLIVTVAIWALALLQLLYALWMRRRGVLH